MTKDAPPSDKHVHPPIPRWARWSLLLNVVATAALLQVAITHFVVITSDSSGSHTSSSHQPALHACRAPLPSFLETKVPSGAEPALQQAFQQDSVLQRQFNQGGIDSLSIAIVSSEGSLYEGFLGKRRVNESDAAVEVLYHQKPHNTRAYAYIVLDSTTLWPYLSSMPPSTRASEPAGTTRGSNTRMYREALRRVDSLRRRDVRAPDAFDGRVWMALRATELPRNHLIRVLGRRAAQPAAVL